MRRVKRIVLTGHEQRAADAIWRDGKKPNAQSARVSITPDFDFQPTIEEQEAFRRRFGGKSMTLTIVYDPESDE